jgi:hypothetical protein
MLGEHIARSNTIEGAISHDERMKPKMEQTEAEDTRRA